MLRQNGCSLPLASDAELALAMYLEHGETFVERLLTEEHVACVPGGAFGPSGEGHVRMCYATGEDEIREALVRIGRFVEAQRRRAGG